MSPEETLIDPPGCDDNAAPYVLGALGDEECEAFRRHQESCAACREEVASLQIVADALPALAPPLSAPVELRRRIMADVEQEAALRAAARHPLPGPSPLPAERRPALAFPGWRPTLTGWRPTLVLAGAIVVIAALLIALLPGGGSSTRVIRAQVLAPRASVSVRLSGGHAELDIAGMPQTAPNRVYEVWVKRTGAPKPTDALFTVTSSGDATVGVPGSVTGVKQILVTSEPLGGSPAPTRTPIIVASIG